MYLNILQNVIFDNQSCIFLFAVEPQFVHGFFQPECEIQCLVSRLDVILYRRYGYHVISSSIMMTSVPQITQNLTMSSC